MSTPAQIMTVSRALLNDQADAVFHNTILLPYFNMALQELQETFEWNNIPVTKKTSAEITVPAETTDIGFNTVPYLPADLIYIETVWERTTGANPYIPMTQLEYLPHYFSGTQINQLLFWAWMDQTLKFIPANAENQIKLDYVAALFSTVTEAGLQTNLTVINMDTFMQYRTASLAARFIGENPSRSDELDAFASIAMDRVLGIGTKGRQSIAFRRRPFMSGYRRIGGNQGY